MVARLGKEIARGCYHALHAPYVLGPCQSKYGTSELLGLCLASHLARSVLVPIVGILLHVCWTPIGRPSLSLTTQEARGFLADGVV